jgi:endonuclease/exonuclease/phosphatase (EEP) superfamily protein YafD
MRPAAPSVAKWARRLVQGAAVAYPLSLVAVAVILRYVGERWWASTVGLYLPRMGFALPLPFLVVALRALRMRWLLSLQALGAVVILFPLMGFVLPWGARAHGEGPTLRLLSFNVNSGHDGVQAVVDQIDHYSPDIVLLQETGGHRAYERFGPLLKARYPTVETAAGQFIMATRYPLASVVDPSISTDGPGSFQRQVLETPLGRVVIYNVHTVSPRIPLFALRGRRGLEREIASARTGDSPIEINANLRASQVKTFAEAAAAETDPVILAGDTNLPGLSTVLHRYLSGYGDGFSRAGWGFGYTFPTDKWRPWMRIDRILADDHFRFVWFDVGHAFHASDHLCVVADLQRL